MSLSSSMVQGRGTEIRILGCCQGLSRAYTKAPAHIVIPAHITKLMLRIVLYS